MTLYNRYLASLALLFTSTTVVLAAYNQQQIDLYFSVYLIEYLAATLLFAYIHQRARRLVNTLGYILVTGFVALVVIKAAQVLGIVGAFQ